MPGGMRRVRLAGFCALAAVLAGCGNDDARPTGAVQGYVYAQLAPGGTLAVGGKAPAGYQPLPGAVITLLDSPLSTTTDAAGAFTLAGVPTGLRRLAVGAPGYRSVTVQVRVQAGETATVGEQLLPWCSRRWTVLVYMNGDNNLERYALADLNELEQVGGSGEVEVLVQLDRCPGYDSSNGDWTGARRYRLLPDGESGRIGSELLAELGEVDMGSPATLADFVRWGQALLPAERSALVIWGHGTGWLPAPPLPGVRPAVSIDDTNGSGLSPQELAQALAGTRLDLVLLDACLMSMVEVGYELRGPGVMVASQDSPPATGYPYHRFLGELTSDPSMSTPAAASLLVDLLVAEQGSSVEAAAVDLAQMPAVGQAVGSLAEALLVTPGAAAAFERARLGSPQMAIADNRDLWALAAGLAGAEGLAAPASQVRAALEAAVIHRAGRIGLHGLSIYAPPPGSYQASYGALALSRDTRWDEWLAGR